MEGILFYQRSNRTLTRHKCKLVIDRSPNPEASDERNFSEDRLIVYRTEDESKFKFCIYLDETLKISVFADLSWEIHINSGKKYRFTAKNWREDQRWYSALYSNLVERYRNFFLSPADREQDNDLDDNYVRLSATGDLLFMAPRDGAVQRQPADQFPIDINDIFDVAINEQRTSPNLRTLLRRTIYRMEISHDQILIQDRNSPQNYVFHASTIQRYGAKPDGLLIELGETSEFGAGLIVFKSVRYPNNKNVYDLLLDLIQTSFTKKWLEIKEESTATILQRSMRRSSAIPPNQAFENENYSAFTPRNNQSQTVQNPEVPSQNVQETEVRNSSLDDRTTPIQTQTHHKAVTQRNKKTIKMLTPAAPLAAMETFDDSQTTPAVVKEPPVPPQETAILSQAPPTLVRKSFTEMRSEPQQVEIVSPVQEPVQKPLHAPPPSQMPPNSSSASASHGNPPVVPVKTSLPIFREDLVFQPCKYAQAAEKSNRNRLGNDGKNLSYTKSMTNLLKDDGAAPEQHHPSSTIPTTDPSLEREKSKSGDLLSDESAQNMRFERGFVRTQTKTTYHKQHHTIRRYGSGNDIVNVKEELANDKTESYDSDTTEYTDESFFKEQYQPNFTRQTREPKVINETPV